MTITRAQAYAIEVRMQEIFEARGIEAEDWPAWDDDIRAQAHKELGIPMPFDPDQHTIDLPKRIKDPKTGEWVIVQEKYLEVRWRLVWFRDRFPHGTIVTEEVCVELDRVVSIAVREYGKTNTKTGTGYARYKTTVTDGEGGMATGYGTENAAEFADYVERAETRSIGRALAGLGIGTQFIGQEMTEMDHVVDGSVSVPQPLPAGSPDDPYLTRLEEQKEMQAAKVTDGPVVGSAPTGRVSAAAKASAALGASGMPSPKTTPITAEKPRLLSRAQLEQAINAEFKRLADGYDTAALCRKAWGDGVQNFSMVRGLSDGSLRTGLKKLQAITVDQPPAPTQAGEGAMSSPAAGSSASAEEDVPTFPPPDGNPQEGPQVAPGSTQGAGLTQVAVVDSSSKGEAARQCPVSSKAGIRCALEVRDDGTHEGEHYFFSEQPDDRPIKLPAYGQVIVVPDPETGVRYISTSDGMLLRQYCQQHDLMSFFTVAVEKSPRNVHGNLMIDERQYWQMRAFAEAQVSTEQQGIPKADFVFDAKGGANLA